MSALDRILTSKGKSGGRVKGRGTVTNRESRRSTPYETTGQKTSILDRLGNQETAKPLRASGTSVTISNLNPDITAQDISELCATVGSVKSVMMQFDSAGRSTGTAEVVFERRSDAMTCVTKFNKVNLDNTPMSVSLTEEIGRQSSESSFNSAPAGPNVREGLFGTAIKDQLKGGFGKKNDVSAGGTTFSVRLDNTPTVSSTSVRGDREPTFSVTVSNTDAKGGRGGGSGRGKGGKANNRDRGNSAGSAPSYFLHDDRDGGSSRSQNQKRGDGGGADADRWVRGGGDRDGGRGGRKGGRGGGRRDNKRGGGGEGRKEKDSTSGMDLDNDLDSYFKNR